MSSAEDAHLTRKSLAPRVIQGMAFRCVFALVILAAMALAGYWVNRNKSRLFTGYQELVSLSGAQRALMSRAALLASRLRDSPDPGDRQQQRQLLEELVTQLELAHGVLLHGSAERGTTAAPPAVRAIYLEPPHELDRRVQSFVTTVRKIIRADDAALPQQRQNIAAIVNMVLDDQLRAAMDTVVEVYKSESDKSFARIRAIETSILVLTLLVIGATGAGVFWPMVRQVIFETNKLESFNAMLDQRAVELVATLQALEQERDERRSRMQAMASVLEDLEEQRGKLEREIQARQLVQDALEASEQRFYAIIESAPTAMVMTDQRGEIVLVNAETERLFGYNREEILGQQIEVLVPERFRQGHPASRTGFFASPETRRMGVGRVLFALRKDGREVPVEIGLNPIETEDGLFVLSAIVDITERKRHEEILRQSEERVRSIVDSALDAVVTIDESGNITGWNPQAEIVFGWTAQETLGKSMAKLVIPPNWRNAHRAGLARFLKTGQGRVLNQRLELTAMRKQGEQFPIEITISPLRIGDRYEFSAFVRDITARKRAELEITRINKELQRKNNEMQQFVYTVSHDLKSPLVTCRGFVGLMKEDAAEGRWDDVLDSVARIERATQRMGDLIEDLLQLSRIGVIRNEPEDVDVGKMLASIAEELGERLQQANASLEIQPNLPPVFADRVRIAEVFENLLSNAIKYGCRVANGRIVVGGKTDQDEVLFFVKDNGPGIPKEFHQKIFGLFQRLESNQEGTGVGLTAVARILEIHAGRVWVESEPGHGATFWIAFPESSDRAAQEIESEPFDEDLEAPVTSVTADAGSPSL